MTHNQREKKQSTKSDSKINQLLKSADDFKAAIINMYKDVKKNDYNKWTHKRSNKDTENIKDKSSGPQSTPFEKKILLLVSTEHWRL